MKKKNLTVWVSTAFILISGCKSRDTVQWDLSPKTITYDLTERTLNDAGNLTASPKKEIGLDFSTTSGQVTLSYDNSSVPSLMTADGKVEPLNTDQSYFFWSPMFLSVLPPDGKVKQGKTWTVKRPTDQEVSASNSLVAQSEIKYEITSVKPYVVKYNGSMQLAGNNGLDNLASQYGIPKVLARTAGTRSKPYLEGTAEFSNEDGYVVSAKGVVRPFAVFGDNAPVSAHPARIEYEIVKK